MRRIKFIEPVESLRGNLSSNQKLLYPTHNNSAWDSPSNKKNYATNYRPSYIGAQRAKDGRTYFSVKVRSAVNMTDAVRMQQALLGASVSLTSSMQKSLPIQTNLQAAYRRAVRLGLTTKNMTKWIQEQTAIYLENQSDIYFNLDSSVFIVENPFVKNHESGAVAITSLNNDVLIKFWAQLATTPLFFTVNGSKGIAHTGDDFQAVAASSYNVLGITATGMVKIGNQWIKDSDGQYVNGDDTITANGVYTLTNVNPAP